MYSKWSLQRSSFNGFVWFSGKDPYVGPGGKKNIAGSASVVGLKVPGHVRLWVQELRYPAACTPRRRTPNTKA